MGSMEVWGSSNYLLPFGFSLVSVRNYKHTALVGRKTTFAGGKLHKILNLTNCFHCKLKTSEDAQPELLARTVAELFQRLTSSSFVPLLNLIFNMGLTKHWKFRPANHPLWERSKSTFPDHFDSKVGGGVWACLAWGSPQLAQGSA